MVQNNEKQDANVNPFVANAYAVVAQDDVVSSNSRVVTASVVEFDRPDLRTVSAAHAHIPEAIGLVWNDDFFDNDDSIIAVFDLDYDKIVSYYKSVSWLAYIGTLFFPNCLWIGLCLGVPCHINDNVNWSVRSQHVAITRNGIVYVQDERNTLWGCPCSKASKSTITIPFDRIADCSVVEPTGTTCCCIENNLVVVNIDTPDFQSNEGQQKQQHFLSIVGLENAAAFHRLVWAMRQRTTANMNIPRSIQQIVDRGAVLQASVASTVTEATIDTSNVNNTDVANLLRDIRDELRQHNAMLQSIQSSPQEQQISPDASIPVVRVEII